MGLKILGTGRAMPDKIVTNNDLSAFLDTNDEWIVSKTGIQSRAVCADETLTDLAEEAGRKALERAQMDAGSVDLLICSTICGDYTLPSLACCVAERLALGCPAFDMNAACTGFLYALDMADAYISSGKARNALIISADNMSRLVDWTDRATCVLFGDGAGACIVTSGDATKYFRLSADADIAPLYVHARPGNSPYVKERDDYYYLHMEGQDVFKFAVRTVEREVDLAVKALGMTVGDMDYFLLHQANKRIIDSARARLKQPEAKFPTNIERYGNMSCASVPVLLDEMVENGSIKPGCTLMLIAFGAGMTAGTCVIKWE